MAEKATQASCSDLPVRLAHYGRLPNYDFEYISTDAGDLYVEFSRDLKSFYRKPVLVTFHDLGYNAKTNFEAFFQYERMQTLLSYFSVIHINAPGQEFFATTLNSDCASFDQMANAVYQVLEHFATFDMIGFGVGAGANILCRFALIYPHMVSGLCLINASFNHKSLSAITKDRLSGFILQAAPNRLLEKFIRKFVLSEYFQRQPCYSLFNVANFGKFLHASLKRTELNFPKKTFGFPILFISGQKSPNFIDSFRMCSRLDRAQFIQIPFQNRILHECPEEVTEMFLQFLHGFGFFATNILGMTGDCSTK